MNFSLLKKTVASLFFVLLFIISFVPTYAQQEPFVEGIDFSRHSIFLELGGNAFAYSLNYDYRFARHASARVGFEYLRLSALGSSSSVLLVPIMVNYLTGKGSSHLELGVGTVLGNAGAGFRDIDKSISGVVGFTGTIGYRLQPADAGFHFRIGLTPILVQGYVAPWAGIGFGYSF